MPKDDSRIHFANVSGVSVCRGYGLHPGGVEHLSGGGGEVIPEGASRVYLCIQRHLETKEDKVAIAPVSPLDSGSQRCRWRMTQSHLPIGDRVPAS